jgi:hypothetical protein
MLAVWFLGEVDPWRAKIVWIGLLRKGIDVTFYFSVKHTFNF